MSATPGDANLRPSRIPSIPRPRSWASLFTRYGVIWGLVLVVIGATIVYPEFLEWENVRTVLSQNAPVGFVALGMTFLMLSGAFDLSAGPALGLTAVVYADAANHMPMELAAAVAIGLGIAIGLANSFVVCVMRVNPFVATLGTGSILTGAAFLYTNSQPVTVTKTGFQTLGTGYWFGVPIGVVLLGFAAVLAAVAMTKTKFGRSIYAIGGNAEASRLCGIRVDLVRAACYCAVGISAAIGGMLIASRLGVVQGTAGDNISLTAIAIVVIGGTSLLGGEGAIWRTAIGVLIIATINNVLDAKAVDSNWQSVVTGAVLIAAVGLDTLGRHLEQRRARRLR